MLRARQASFRCASARPATRQQIDGALYADLLRPISPRILVLNACSTITGSSLSSYIGMAAECLDACGSVVRVQTEVPVGAAKRFGKALLGHLADGVPLSLAVQQALWKMVAGEPVAPFTKFIPVQLTRGRADPRSTSTRTSETACASSNGCRSIDRCSCAMPTRGIDALLANGTGVALIDGPAEPGESTIVRRRVGSLIGDAAQKSLVLYLSAATCIAWEVDPAHRVRQLVRHIVNHFGWLTRSLSVLLEGRSTAAAADAVADLATRLAEQARIGRRGVIVVDDLPDEVAAELATLAANAVDDGAAGGGGTRAAGRSADRAHPHHRSVHDRCRDRKARRSRAHRRTAVLRGVHRPRPAARRREARAAVSPNGLHALRLAALSTILLLRASPESIPAPTCNR